MIKKCQIRNLDRNIQKMVENGSTDIDKSTKITKISVLGLILSFGVLFLDVGNVDKNSISYAAFHAIVNALIGRVLFQSNWNIWLCANFLGYSFVAGLMLATRSKLYCSLGYYIILMLTFQEMNCSILCIISIISLNRDSR